MVSIGGAGSEPETFLVYDSQLLFYQNRSKNGKICFTAVALWV